VFYFLYVGATVGTSNSGIPVAQYDQKDAQLLMFDVKKRCYDKYTNSISHVFVRKEQKGDSVKGKLKLGTP
jgi:hypothetical protein